jgi:hypothetical protein
MAFSKNKRRRQNRISVFNNTNNLISFVFSYTIALMVFTYQELLKKYGNERQIRNALTRQEIYLVGRGFYSDEPGRGKDYFAKRYPSIVFTGKTAFYHYGLTDAAPEVIEVASPLGSTRILEKEARQSFQIASFFPIGKTLANGLPFYDKERMLIELFRLKKRYAYDYYKEVLNSYRSQSENIDFSKVAKYLSKMGASERLLLEIREAF